MYIVHTSDWYQTKLFAQVNFESDHEDEEDVDMGTETTLIRKIITTKIKKATFQTNRHDKHGEGGGVPPLPVQLEGVDSTRRARVPILSRASGPVPVGTSQARAPRAVPPGQRAGTGHFAGGGPGGGEDVAGSPGDG